MRLGLLKKFILYLPDFYFKSNCCGRCNSKLIDTLQLRGIHVLSYENVMNNYLYDDSNYPEVNILYTWLTDNKYYSDRIFFKKKTELEREILLLLTGILGGETIECNSYLRINESISVNQTINAGLVDESVQLRQINSESNSIEKNEMYGNTGAPILLKSETWEELKENIKDYFHKIDENTIVSYNYFKNNSDLLLFAFKRFKLKLSDYHYKIEEDKSSEKSIQIRTILKEFGLSGDLESKYSYSKTHLYKIKFYTMEELNKIYDTELIQEKLSENRKNDIFSKLRYEYEINNNIMKKVYSDWGGDEKPIYNECINYAKQLNICEILQKWMDDNASGEFNGCCHYFKSKGDVDWWFEQNLKVKIN